MEHSQATPAGGGPTTIEHNVNPRGPLQQFVAYAFDSDETYQQGLVSILSGEMLEGKTEEQKEVINRQCQVFYFNRITGQSVTVDDVRAYEQSLKADLRSNASSVPRVLNHTSEEDVTILTFSQLKDLIESGKTDQIPNNRHIPDALNDAPPSQSSAPIRKKPWEADTE